MVGPFAFSATSMSLPTFENGYERLGSKVAWPTNAKPADEGGLAAVPPPRHPLTVPCVGSLPNHAT